MLHRNVSKSFPFPTFRWTITEMIHDRFRYQKYNLVTIHILDVIRVQYTVQSQYTVCNVLENSLALN